MSRTPVEVIPLGGLGEFGMNCAAIRCGSDMILIDAGMAFPRNEGSELGVRIIVPDIAFLKENESRLKGIFLTHGHEDHAGAVSFIINELDLPVYGSPLTLGLVAARLAERQLLNSANLIELRAREKLRIGDLTIEPLNVTHSYPDSFCFVITTPQGVLVWSGDFKFDQTPSDGRFSDIHRLATYGEEGVLALFSDSTNSSSPGMSPSEHSVREPLRNIFRAAGRKIIASTFSSSVHRIQILLDLAQEFGRQVVPLGRSMVTTIRIARELGYLRASADLIISSRDARELPSEKVLVLASGSQGEPMSALSQLAISQFKKIVIDEDDIVVLSARIIPGNERSISNLVNHLFRRGAKVYDSNHSQIHVSGHGYRDDLKLMISLTQPKFFIPIHGEFRQLKNHCWLATEQGIPEKRVRLIENGDLLKLTAEEAVVSEKVQIGRRMIDDGILEEVHEMVLRERRYLSEDGFVMVILRLNRLTGDLIGEPEIVTRGFILVEQSEDLMTSVRDRIVSLTVETCLEEKRDEVLFNEILRKELKRFFRKKTGKRPIILSMTIEI
jgi:ribonuclease J